MRQRNETGYRRLVVPPQGDAFEVQDGEVVDFPVLVAGLTPVEEPAIEVPAVELVTENPKPTKPTGRDKEPRNG